VSPGLLPPLGIMFALFVAFTASQVWNDNNRAQTAVDHEASALKTIVVLSESFSGDTEARLRDLIRDHIMGHSNKRVDALAPGERHSEHYSIPFRRRAAVYPRANTEYRRSKTAQRDRARHRECEVLCVAASSGSFASIMPNLRTKFLIVPSM